MKMMMLLMMLMMLMSINSVFARENLTSEAIRMAQSSGLNQGEVIVGIKTSKMFFSVAGLLFKDQTLATNENVAIAGENKFYRVKKDSSLITLSVCGVVLLMEPANKEWKEPKNLDPNKLVEVVVIDSEGRSLDAQYFNHNAFQNAEHCNVFRF